MPEKQKQFCKRTFHSLSKRKPKSDDNFFLFQTQSSDLIEIASPFIKLTQWTASSAIYVFIQVSILYRGIGMASEWLQIEIAIHFVDDNE